jgi:hypothetical protein
VWFTINDSGNEPVLFALDTTGRARDRWRISGASNRDWEAITLGRCLPSNAGEQAADVPHCLYIGDVGDNGAQRRSVRVYRLEEPDVRRTERGPRIGNRESGIGASARGTLSATALTFTYEGGPRDVEAMYAGPDGTIYLVSKRALEDPNGRPRPALVFALPPHAWHRTDSVAVAVLVDSLPIVPGTALGRQTTDAALSRDRSAVAVRTYTQLYVFRADPATGRVLSGVPPTICSIAGLEEKQGEGITWFADAGTWLLTSEGRHEPLRVIECPPPDAAQVDQPR